ncbi:MAG: sigma-70 family RNA polymerase sigma factor [Phycisphaerales bacterium]|nr:sigma-70 family RNA polymerase sigma factor [Phycisphaerales bacterium]
MLLKSLLERIAGGDHSAVELCAREYGGLVYRLAKRYLDQAPSEVEDAVQDVFIEIWTSAKRFDPSKGSESAFVATIAHRRIIDKQRQVSSRRRVLRRVSTQSFPKPNERSDSSAIVNDEQNIMAKAYIQLSENEREAIWMSIFGGLTHYEIGIATNSPIGTVNLGSDERWSICEHM